MFMKKDRKIKHFLVLAAFLAATGSAMAGDWVIGLGKSHFNGSSGDRSTILSLELHSDPFFTKGRLSASYMGVITAHSSGDMFAGVGLSALYELNGNWFLEGSVAPGLFAESGAIHDLGSAFEIRSLLGVGYALGSGDRISLALTHKSNAGTASHNPGVNSVLLRYRHSF